MDIRSQRYITVRAGTAAPESGRIADGGCARTTTLLSAVECRAHALHCLRVEGPAEHSLELDDYCAGLAS